MYIDPRNGWVWAGRYDIKTRHCASPGLSLLICFQGDCTSCLGHKSQCLSLMMRSLLSLFVCDPSRPLCDTCKITMSTLKMFCPFNEETSGSWGGLNEWISVSDTSGIGKYRQGHVAFLLFELPKQKVPLPLFKYRIAKKSGIGIG